MLTEEKILSSLRKVKDPELGLDIVSLGLIYKVSQENDAVKILMTLTFPGCPYGPELLERAKKEVAKISQGKKVEIDVTFNPPWDLKMISTEAKLYLGIKN